MVLRPFQGTVDVREQPVARERSGYAHVLEEVSELGIFRERTQQQILAFLGEAVVRLEQDLGTGAVDFVDALEIDDHVGHILAPRRLEVGREVFSGAEKDRPLQLEHQDPAAVLGEHIHEPGLTCLARMHRVATVGAADHRLAHAEQEKQHCHRDPDRHGNHQVHGDRDHRHDHDDQEIEQHALRAAEIARGEPAHDLQRPAIHQLDRHHHQHGRDHDTGQITDER